MNRLKNADKESGYAIAMVSLLMIPLLGFMALAIDVGAWYTQATRVQRAADAAALSSVVWMPDTARAQVVAVETMTKHGIDFSETFVHPANGITPRWDLTVEPVPSNSFQVRVILTDNNAPVYFGDLFVDNVEITRQAIAEFVKPIPMGSRSNGIGLQCDANGTPGNNECDGVAQSGFSLSAFGPREAHRNGDAFLSKCLDNSYTLPCPVGEDNPNYQSLGADGYTLAIDVPTPNTPVTVQFFDPYSTGRGTVAGQPRDVFTDIVTKFTVYEADGSNLTTDVITPIAGCDDHYTDVGTELTWVTHCTFTAQYADIYPIRIQTSNFAEADESATGWNGYGVRAFFGSPMGGPKGTDQHYDTTVNPQPRVYAMDWLAIESHSAISNFDLAEIGPEHAGKTVSLKLFDAGDGSGAIDLRVWTPFGFAQDCRVREWQDPNPPPDIGPVRPGECVVVTKQATESVGEFQDKWAEIQIPIPANYTCTDCWWEIRYNGSFSELTNWGVSILGDPVRLVG